jgi:hypothetical protein
VKRVIATVPDDNPRHQPQCSDQVPLLPGATLNSHPLPVPDAVDSALALARSPETDTVSAPRSQIHHPPEHPRLVPYAPVIQRSTNEVQVGIDPDTALVFRGTGFSALLPVLDGTRPMRAVHGAARAAGLTTPELTAAIDALAAAGLLTDRTAGRTSMR